MESNGLRQFDLLDVFGTASVASEVLSGKESFQRRILRDLALVFMCRLLCSFSFFDQIPKLSFLVYGASATWPNPPLLAGPRTIWSNPKKDLPQPLPNQPAS